MFQHVLAAAGAVGDGYRAPVGDVARDDLATKAQEALDRLWETEGAPVVWDDLGEAVADALFPEAEAKPEPITKTSSSSEGEPRG